MTGERGATVFARYYVDDAIWEHGRAKAGVAETCIRAQLRFRNRYGVTLEASSLFDIDDNNTTISYLLKRR